MPASATDLKALSRLLDEALALVPGARQAWLAALPPTDAPFRGQLERMLAETSVAGDQDLTLPSLGPPGAEAAHEGAEQSGMQVGPYRLVRRIGAGGMASVWLAQRADGTMDRDVALKLPHVTWSPALNARLAREREILARLTHPNIARLYDAGADEQGRPFLAMEYVEGLPVDEYAKRSNLPIRQRLTLFLQIAGAVAYAHARLVVHRDLKPGNVLVGSDGQVRLLDFGIAKLMQGEETTATQLTEMSGAAMTPDYASPEQIRGEPITVASDVYSLGVILYEMLTGARPFSFKGRMVDAIAEASAETEPPAASRIATDQRTERTLRGDLDRVLGKALKKDPSQRYPTVEAFAADVQRYLEGMPIQARPSSASYRARKFIARHQLGMAGSLVTLIAIVSTAAMALWQAHRAELEAQHAKKVQQFVSNLFRSTNSGDSNSPGLEETPAELLLERGAHQIDAEFKDQPELRAELTGVIAKALLDLSLGERAAEQAERQLKMLEENNATVNKRVDAMELLARAQMQQSLMREAETTLRKMLDLASTVGVSRSIDVELLLFDCLIWQRSDQAPDYLAAAEAHWNAQGGADPVQRARIEIKRAVAYWFTRKRSIGEIEEALKHAVKLAEMAGDQRRELQIEAWGLLGQFLAIWTQYERSAEFFDKQVSLMREINGEQDFEAAAAELEGLARSAPGRKADDVMSRLTNDQMILERLGSRVPRTVSARANMHAALAFLNIGDLDHAKPLFEKASAALDLLPESIGERNIRVFMRGGILRDAGEHSRADAIYRRGIELFKRDGSWLVTLASILRAWNLVMSGEYQQAEEILDTLPSVTGRERSIELARAEIDLAHGRLQEAKRRVGARNSLQEIDNFGRGVFVANLHAVIAARCEGSAPADEVAILAGLLAQREAYEILNSPYLASNRAQLGICLLKLGDVSGATNLAVAARRAFDAQPKVSPYFKKPLLQLEQQLSKIGAFKSAKSKHAEHRSSYRDAESPADQTAP